MTTGLLDLKSIVDLKDSFGGSSAAKTAEAWIATKSSLLLSGTGDWL